MVVFSFFLCWAPFHAQRLGYVYFKESPVFRVINEYLMYVSGICYYVSSTINPILYNVMSVKYRQAFRRTLCGMSPHQQWAGGHGGTWFHTEGGGGGNGAAGHPHMRGRLGSNYDTESLQR